MIYIVRHGETDINVEDRVNDSNIDTGINATGKDQARRVGIYLKNVRKLNKNNCIMITSPAIRTVQTALIIKSIINKGIKLISDDRIIETNKGILSGLKKDDKLNKKYIAEFDKLTKSADTLSKNEKIETALNTLTPKYKMESVEKIRTRLREFFNDLSVDGENIIVVTHGGIITNILLYIMKIYDVMSIGLSNGANCSITVIEKTGQQTPEYKLLTFPNIEHLSKRVNRSKS